MRRYRNVLILLVVMVILVGGAVYMVKTKGNVTNNEEDTTTTENQEIKVLDLNKNDIAEITLENKDLKFIITHKENDWVLTYPEGINYNKSTTEGEADTLAELKAIKVIEENASDLKQYGFDGTTTATVKMKDGKVRTLEIGGDTPTKEGVYIKEKENSKVYMMNSFYANNFRIDKYYFRDKNIITNQIESVTGFTVEKGSKLSFKVRKQSDGKWTMVQPVECNVKAENIDLMLQSVPSIVVSEYIEDNPADLSKYGLDKPAYTLEVEFGGTVKRLFLGKEKNKGSEIYAKLSNGNEVFTLALTPFNYLDMPLKQLMDTLVYIVDIKDVSDIEVNMDGKMVKSHIETDAGGDKTKDKFTVDGKEANAKDSNGESYFRNYYQALISLVLNELEIDAKPTGTPEVTITYTLKKSPGTVKVELVPKDANNYYALVDGKYNGKVVTKASLDATEGIRDSYKKMMEGINKK